MYKKITPTDNVKIFKDLISGQPDDSVEDQSRWEEIGALLYTGGTTGVSKGVSKGVMLTHSNLSCNVQQFIAWFPDLQKGEESLVGNFPVFHSSGFTAIQNFCLWQAYEIILVPRPEPAINKAFIVPKKGETPMDRLIHRYMNRFPCPSRTRATDRSRRLLDILNQSRASGIVFIVQKFCTPHLSDIPILSESLKEQVFPSILIEMDETWQMEGQVKTRLEGFFEMIGERSKQSEPRP